MVKVLALPGNCAMQTCNTLVGGTPATRELVLAVSGSICGLERLFILPQEVRILNRLQATIVCGDGGKGFDSPVKS